MENPSFWAIFLSPGDSDEKKICTETREKAASKNSKIGQMEYHFRGTLIVGLRASFLQKGSFFGSWPISSLAPFWTMKLPKCTENPL